MRLKDKRAVVTGAAHGIGRATASRFAEEGARVALVDIDQQAGQAAAKAVCEAGGRAEFFFADVTSKDDVEKLIDEVDRQFGGVDVWMNNAGGSCTEDLLELEPGDWSADIALNLTSHYLCCRAALSRMTRAGRGSIINVSSVNAIWSIGEFGYSAAKAGLISFTRNLAVRYGQHGVRANVICPGTIDTERGAAYWDRKSGAKEKLLKWYPLGRLGRPEEVANLALFLASDESSFISGSVLVIDGGLTAGCNLFGG